jgi:hypothetical protein
MSDRIICYELLHLEEQAYSSKSTMIRVLGFDSRRGLGIFLFTTVSGTALGLTKPPIQWAPGALFLGVK